MAGSPQHATLVANTVLEVDFDRDYTRVEVVNVDGPAAIYFRTDGVAPVVGATGCHVLPATICSIEVDVVFDGPTAVKLISTGTPKVSVRGIA